MGWEIKKEEEISTQILKVIYESVKSDFVKIINRSLEEGVCPKEWKVSTVIPIPKINKTVLASEFRPINMLPVYEKVLELVVKQQLDKFIEGDNILIEHQFVKNAHARRQCRWY